jgi:hypothetical protein
MILVTSLDYPAAIGQSAMFHCEAPGIKLTSPDPQQTLTMNQTYQIAWQYYGDPGPHVRIDLLSADGGGYNMQVFNTPAQSTAVQGSGAWGQGQYSWTLTNKGPRRQFYIQFTGVENPNVWDRNQYYIAAGTGGTSGSGGVTSTTTTTSTTTGSTSQQLLTSDTYFKYNSSSSALFAKGSTVTLDASGYAVKGQLAGAFGPGTDLPYSTGNNVRFQGGSLIIFSGNCVSQGVLAGGFGVRQYCSPIHVQRFYSIHGWFTRHVPFWGVCHGRHCGGNHDF